MAIYRVELLYDDGNEPVADFGPSAEFDTRAKAKRWAKRELAMMPVPRVSEVWACNVAQWYASIDEGEWVEDDTGLWPPLDPTWQGQNVETIYPRTPQRILTALAR